MTVYGPFLEITHIQSEINKLFDHLVELKGSEAGELGAWTPNVDVVETHQEWIVQFELPGVDPAQVRLSVAGNQLVLTGEKEPPRPDNAIRFHCVERGYGKFHRAIPIGAAVNPRQARVQFLNGLLKVQFPKVQNRRGDEVNIQVPEHGGGS